MFSTFVCGYFRVCILRPSIPIVRYTIDFAFLSAMSHGLSPHNTPILSIRLRSFFHLATAWLYLVSLSFSLHCLCWIIHWLFFHWFRGLYDYCRFRS